ncbi:MAG: hypothetical protein H6772_03340 [Pseudomonadales bacterium]|nr:hypothetical protein [Pseudomonadales bacterium]
MHEREAIKLAANQELFLIKLARNIEAGADVPVDVIAHVKENLAIPTSESSICVDGGYSKEEAQGELARPGADLGISIALLKMNFTPEQAFLTVYNYRVMEGQKYGWHSDKHVDPKYGQSDGDLEDNLDHEVQKVHNDHHEVASHSDAICGCGHCNAANNSSSEYELDPNQVLELLNIVKQYQASHPENMRFVNLDRDHNEKGILVIDSDEVTVYPWDKEKGVQFFVYDSKRDQQLLANIVEYINLVQTDNLITYEQFKQIVEDHTQATLGLLGSSKGKPIYTISVENGKLTIKSSGNAPIIEEQ